MSWVANSCPACGESDQNAGMPSDVSATFIRRSGNQLTTSRQTCFFVCCPLLAIIYSVYPSVLDLSTYLEALAYTFPLSSQASWESIITHDMNYVSSAFALRRSLKKNQNARRPSEHPPVGGGEMSYLAARYIITSSIITVVYR